MFEVKVTFMEFGRETPVQRQMTIATFEAIRETDAMRIARAAAIRFAKQIDKGFAVDVVNVADEDNREKAFGLVYHRDASF